MSELNDEEKADMAAAQQVICDLAECKKGKEHPEWVIRVALTSAIIHACKMRKEKFLLEQLNLMRTATEDSLIGNMILDIKKGFQNGKEPKR